MTDETPTEPADVHDGNTKPLPSGVPTAPTEQFAPVGGEPVRAAARTWLPWILLGVVIVIVGLLAALLLPRLLGQAGVPATPAPTVVGTPSPTPTDDATDTAPAPAPAPSEVPAPEPTATDPLPTPDPSDIPTPTPTP